MNKQNEVKIGGFTIMETIVAINLAFLTVTFIVSFYLFSLKFTGSVVNKITVSNELNNILFRIEEKLRKAEYFRIESEADGLFFVLDNKDSLFFSDWMINLDNVFTTKEFERTEIDLLLKEGGGKIIVFSREEEGTTESFMPTEVILSQDILEISFRLFNREKVYEKIYYTAQNPITRFRNIKK